MGKAALGVLCVLGALASSFSLSALAADYPEVIAGKALEFPRDHGAHPDFRTEWWYATGWLEAAGKPLGFQVTFFRVRNPDGERSASSFAPAQLLFAHAALADPAAGRLLHDQRAARAGFGLAEAKMGDTEVRIDRWSFAREGDGYLAQIAAAEFAFELRLAPTQPILLNGEAGWSRKARDPRHASYYYSQPQLAVRGSVTRGGRRVAVTGSAWLDHEWSSEYMPEGAAGWDWTGINLAGGGALMAFRMRDAAGATLWSAGSLRSASGATRALAPEEVSFSPLRTWRSPRTGAAWPVAMRVRAAELELELQPLLDDQELDSRAGLGAVYWEGAVRALADGREVGRGYLELTGYAERLRMGE